MYRVPPTLSHPAPAMMISPVGIVLACSSLVGGATAWAPARSSLISPAVSRHHAPLLFAPSSKNDDTVPITSIGSFTGDFLAGSDDTLVNLAHNKLSIAAPLAVALLPLEANAADGSSGGQIASAFAAYGHYLSLFVIVGCLVTERLTIRANMSDEEEDRLAIADTTLGVAGFVLAYTGYLRTTADWGKGFDYCKC